MKCDEGNVTVARVGKVPLSPTAHYIDGRKQTESQRLLGD